MGRPDFSNVDLQKLTINQEVAIHEEVFETNEGIPVKPAYSQEDIADLQ